MKRSIRLALKKETLAALDGDDMRLVGGAADNSAMTCYSCPLDCPIIHQRSLIIVTDCCQGIPTFDHCTT